MSTSSDGILLYGIQLEEDGEYEDDDFGDEDVVEIRLHCCDSYPMYFLAIKGTATSAYRGYPEDVTGKDLSRNPEYDALLKEVCETNEFVTVGTPGWHLCSWMG